MQRKKLKIGLFGFGCVGQGLYEVLSKTQQLNAEIIKICVKQKHKSRTLPDEYFTLDKNEILNNDEINVVVELIDDAASAFEIVSQALKKGKHVVSANKKMIAENMAVLIELQAIHKVSLLYEAACCASIPILRNLEEYYDNDLLESIEGIVNGSTNYILDKTSGGLNYKQALQEAQQLGYAESDPTLDTEGYDSKYKLLLLLTHGFGIVADPRDVFQLGISRLTETDLSYAKEKNYRIKLVALATKTDEGVRALVLPKFIDANDRLYSVHEAYNGVKTRCGFSDAQFFYGKGAGAHPTASAVISDLSALTYDYKYEYKKLGSGEKLCPSDNIRLKVLMSFNPEITCGDSHRFIKVFESFRGGNKAYVIGEILLSELIKLSREDKNCSFIYFDVVEKFSPTVFDLAELEAIN